MKKIILPTLLINVFLAILLTLQSNAFAFFHDKGSESELDCYDTAVEITKDSNKSKVAQWGDRAGGQLYYDSSPKTISKNQGENYCLLTKTQKFEGIIDDEYVLKITYSPELLSLSDKFNALKENEEGDFETKDNSENDYSGRTARGDPTNENTPNYARKVSILGNCLVEFTYRTNKTPALLDQPEFAKTLADAVLETLKNYHATIVSSEKLQSFCGGKADNQQEEALQSQQSQPSQTDKQKKQSQDGNPLRIFGFNPFETWRNILGLLNVPRALDYLVRETEFLSEPKDIKVEIPEPAMSRDDEGKAWDFLKDYVPQGSSVMPYKEQAEIKLPGENETKTFDVGEGIPSGSTIPLADPAQYIDTGGFLVVTQAFHNEGALITPKGNNDNYHLEGGQMEVIKKSDSSAFFSIKTPNAVVTVSRTHYLVRYDKNNDQTMVVVYDGKVKVESTDGKTTEISPNGDKPGVVVVTQRLSVAKVAIAGVVLAVILGGVVLILKKKFSAKKTN